MQILKNTIISAMLFIAFGCCKEDARYSENEIVQTNSSGDIIGGNITSKDWKLVDFNSSSYFNEVSASLISLYTTYYNDTIQIKNHCKADSFHIRFYSNPMVINQESYTRIYLPTKIKDAAYGYRNKRYNLITTYSVGIYGDELINENTLKLPISKPQFTYGEDVEIFFCIIDSNNCGYFFSGKVKLGI
ncbi:MAG: hypothetical protein ACOVP5_06895 [Chitinophagales bacterium]